MARIQAIICYMLYRPSDYYNKSIWHCFRCWYSPDASGLQVNIDQALKWQILAVKPNGGVSLSAASDAVLLWMQLFLNLENKVLAGIQMNPKEFRVCMCKSRI